MSDPHWTVGDDGLLRHDNCIYVPDANDLQLQVLQDKHDHVLLGHFGQGKTLDLVRHEYYWPNLWPFVIEFCKSCVMCKHSKAPRHWPYGYLKQLPQTSVGFHLHGFHQAITELGGIYGNPGHR